MVLVLLIIVFLQVTTVDKFQGQANKMISFCFLLFVLALSVTFVMLEDWWLPCLVLALAYMSFVAILCLNNVMNSSLLSTCCFRDLIILL